tara:strand:+ start:405 stop:581 length:177 start_codon:yes stop_codon:yes gene_type:complete
MIKNILQKIKKWIAIGLIIAAVVLPLWASFKLNIIQIVNTEDLAAISFNKMMFKDDTE